MSEIDNIYKEEAEKHLKSLKGALQKLKVDISDKKAIKKISIASHTLKGSSLQMGYYSVAYLARLMEDFTKEVVNENIPLDKKKIAFLFDFLGSLEKTLVYATKNKKYKVNVKLFETLDRLMGTEKGNI